MSAMNKPATPPGRDKARIFANTREMLAMAEGGLTDFVSGDPRRRRPGLMNLFTYGRSVTMTMQTMRNTDARFNAWWTPLQTKMAQDPLMKFFNQTRTDILHEGELSTANYTAIGMRGPVDLGAIIRDMRRYAPPNTISTFLGDQTGGNGWEVQMPDGSIEKVYFQLPEGVDIESGLQFADPPTQHYGVPITDTSIGNLGRVYLRTLANMVEEFIERFAD